MPKFQVILTDNGEFFKFPNQDGKAFFDFFKKNTGKLCQFDFKLVKNTKSNQQNRYFRGVIVPHFKKALWEAGYQSFTDEEYFQLLKQKFFSYQKGKKTFFYSTCNSDWETDEWENKMTEIRNWLFEMFNYVVPLPNE